jgi:type IV pilus assembly protein PilY1
VAIFGNGYRSTYDSPVPQAHLFVVEVETGVVRTLALPKTTEANGLGGVALRRNEQGLVIGAYAGDLTGRLWRFDYSEGAASFFSVGLGEKPLFQAATGQAIMQAPWVQLSGQTVRLAFGTGRLITDQDANGKAVQAVYVVEDRVNETLSRPLGPDQLEARELSLLTLADAKAGSTFFQVSTPTIDWAQRRGWRLPLTGEGVPAGLRVLQPLQPLVKGNDLLLIAAESPAVAGDPCDLAQGKGVNLLLKASGGPAPTRPILDTTGDGVVNSSDSALAAGYQTVADGADAVLQTQSSSGAGSGGTSGTGSTTGGSATKCSKQLQIMGSNESMVACASGSGALKARVWRRILQPPF